MLCDVNGCKSAQGRVVRVPQIFHCPKMELRVRKAASAPISPDLPFPIGPPRAISYEEILVDRLNRQGFKARSLAAADDLLAQALMSTKKETPVHRMTIPDRIVSPRLDNAILLEINRAFIEGSRKQTNNSEELAESIWSIVSGHALLQADEKACFIR